MLIIDRLLMLMNEKNISMADLSRFLRLNTSTTSNWKTKRRNPPAEYISPICEFLGVSVDFLLTGEEKEAAPDKKESVEPDDHEEVMMLYDSLDKEGKTIVKAVCYQEQRRMNRTE